MKIAGNTIGAQMLRSGIGSMGVKIAYISVQFAVGVMLARTLGPEALGAYAFIIALVQLLVIAAQFGFPAYLVRAVAVARAKEDYAELGSLILGAQQIVLGFALLLVTGAGLWIWAAGSAFDGIPSSALLVGLLLVPLQALCPTRGAAIRGFGHVVYGQLPDEIVRPVVFLTVLTALYVFNIVLTPERALLAHASALFVALAFAGVILDRIGRASGSCASGKMRRTEWLRESFPFLLLGGTQVLNYQTDVLMLGLLATQEAIGHYRVALQISEGLGVILIALSATMAPQLARLHTQQDWSKLQRLLIYGHRAGTIALLPLGMGVAFFAAPLVVLVFGSDYLPAAPVLAILALGKVAYASVAFSGLALSMMGRAGTAALATSATMVMNIALNLLLIPHYGVEGAAIATAISQFVLAAGTVLYLQIAMDLKVSLFHRER